jgi:hypothetical protein
MLNNTTGNNNISLGLRAGANLTAGSNNIAIGNAGAAESNTIRIGVQGTQTATFVAGISGAAVTGNAVVVNGAGKLGIVMSAARYKRDIRDMGAASEGLMKLRPVVFRYRNDPEGIQQYGLVAEEVARIYPELVSQGADGKVETVRYLTLIAMLLNELQKQTRENARQGAQLRRQNEQVTSLSAQMHNETASTERMVAQLQENHDRELRAIRAAFERRIAAVEQSLRVGKNSKVVAAFNR